MQQQVGHNTDKIHYSLNLATQDTVLFNFCIPTNGEQQFTKFQSDCIIFDDVDCVNML